MKKKRIEKVWVVLVHRDEKAKRGDLVEGCMSRTYRGAVGAFLGTEGWDAWTNRWAQPRGCYSVRRVTIDLSE